MDWETIPISWRIHGAGILMLTWLGYIDGIHGTPYMAAPLGSVMGDIYIYGYMCYKHL